MVCTTTREHRMSTWYIVAAIAVLLFGMCGLNPLRADAPLRELLILFPAKLALFITAFAAGVGAIAECHWLLQHMWFLFAVLLTAASVVYAFCVYIVVAHLLNIGVWRPLLRLQ